MKKIDFEFLFHCFCSGMIFLIKAALIILLFMFVFNVLIAILGYEMFNIILLALLISVLATLIGLVQAS